MKRIGMNILVFLLLISLTTLTVIVTSRFGAAIVMFIDGPESQPGFVLSLISGVIGAVLVMAAIAILAGVYGYAEHLVDEYMLGGRYK